MKWKRPTSTSLKSSPPRRHRAEACLLSRMSQITESNNGSCSLNSSFDAELFLSAFNMKMRRGMRDVKYLAYVGVRFALKHPSQTFYFSRCQHRCGSTSLALATKFSAALMDKDRSDLENISIANIFDAMVRNAHAKAKIAARIVHRYCKSVHDAEGRRPMIMFDLLGGGLSRSNGFAPRKRLN